ncbi:MAG: M28 family peptidase [Candidatus Thermoplasmatota archaeon]|nr:M28 family peptidase [Candidatus Thermoplasmatota archaeon]
MPRARSLLVALVCLATALTGCTTPSPAPPASNGTDPSPTPGLPGEEAPGIGEANASTLQALVEAQVYREGDPEQPRYRIPGTQGHAETVGILSDLLGSRGLSVEQERFQVTMDNLGEVNLTNLYGTRDGAGTGEVWLAAHWDSRAWADGTTGDDCVGVGEPVLGANDGAAGVAVVLHAVELLPETNLTVRVVLFDGEDQGCPGTRDGPGYAGTGWAVGSTQAAQAATSEEVAAIEALILVDMPGDENVEFRKEGAGYRAFPALTDLVYGIAHERGAPMFLDEPGPSILDDHRAFLDRGVPSVDLIHLDDERGPGQRGVFPSTHHTTKDTPERLSYEAMAQVSEVVAASVVALDEGALAG